VWSLTFRFSDQNFVCIFHLSHACCLLHPSYQTLTCSQIIFGEAYKLIMFYITGKILGFLICATPWGPPMGTRGSFPGDKAAGAWSWPFTSI
jgi:hypothetical protein